MPDGFKDRKRRGSILAAAVVLLYVIPLICLMLWLAAEIGRSGETMAAALLVAFYGASGGAVVIGVMLALRERLREIEGGEEEDAGEY